MTKLIPLKTFDNRLDAETAAATLDAAGISVQVVGEGNLDSRGTVTGVNLFVQEEQVDKARELLQ